MAHKLSDGIDWYWPAALETLRDQFQSGSPYPHLVLDRVFPPDALLDLYADVPDQSNPLWRQWGSGGPENCLPQNSKRGISALMLLSDRISFFLKQLNSDVFLRDIRAIAGMPDLTIDPTFNGGGLHCTGRGGHLRIHSDKVRHPRPSQFDQALNLILFINPHWCTEFGGALELWSRDAAKRIVSISPLFNRLVLFQSDRSTYHGHPEPVLCPNGMYRSSLAVYYYVPRKTPLLLLENEIDFK